MLLDLPPEAVALLGDLLPKVHAAVATKAEQVSAAIDQGIIDPANDHVGVFMAWPLYVESMGEDLATLRRIIDTIQALQAPEAP